MRILHILDHSLPLHSGYAFRTISILREQRARGWETVHLTTPRQGPSKDLLEVSDGWEFHRTPAPLRTLPIPAGHYFAEMRQTKARIVELCTNHKPDVLHAHSPVLNALPAIRVGHQLGIPVVYELRASWEDAAVDHGTTKEGSLRYRLSRWLETYALHRVDRVTTICEGLRGDIISRGIPAERVTVIPNAVDPQSFSLISEPDLRLKAKLGIGSETVIGFAGSFYGYEGLDLLLDATARLLKRGQNVKILLVGGGPQEQALRVQVQDLHLSDRVLFVGRVPHADVQRYYGLIDVLAYPRHRIRLTELVTPLKPLEAMAQGLMLVASDVGGHKELIRDRETGFLFPAEDADALAATLEHVLSRRHDWPRVRANARLFVEQERNWTRSVAGYADVYADVTRAQSLSPNISGRRAELK